VADVKTDRADVSPKRIQLEEAYKQRTLLYDFMGCFNAGNLIGYSMGGFKMICEEKLKGFIIEVDRISKETLRLYVEGINQEDALSKAKTFETEEESNEIEICKDSYQYKWKNAKIKEVRGN